MRVLIADDDRVTVELLASVLTAQGHESRAAFDSMQAVMFALRDRPDAIILDIGMPGGGGLNVLQRLKASTKTRTIPVIVLTVLADPTLPDQAKALGADAFLRKPVDAGQLRDALQRVAAP